MTILGIIIIIIGLITMFLRPQLNEQDAFERTEQGEMLRVKSKSPSWLLMFTKKNKCWISNIGTCLLPCPTYFLGRTRISILRGLPQWQERCCNDRGNQV